MNEKGRGEPCPYKILFYVKGLKEIKNITILLIKLIKVKTANICRKEDIMIESTKEIIKHQVNYYVSEHFMFSDFICPCCDCIKIVPGFYEHVGMLEKMIKELGFGIKVNSGYRCIAHNAEIGGSSHSWHLLFATDISPENRDSEKLKTIYKTALCMNIGGIGLYEYHVHLDLRPEQARWRG